MATYNEKNEEIPDNTPVEVPLGFGHPEPLENMIMRLVNDRIAQSELHSKKGLETFEEADDLDIPDSEGDLQSPYQMTPMQEEIPREGPYVRHQGRRATDEPSNNVASSNGPPQDPKPPVPAPAQQ